MGIMYTRTIHLYMYKYLNAIRVGSCVYVFFSSRTLIIIISSLNSIIVIIIFKKTFQCAAYLGFIRVL